MPADQSDVLPLKGAYAFGRDHGLATEVNAIEKMAFPNAKKPSSIRRAYIVRLFQQHNVLNTFIAEFWPFGATRRGPTKMAWYEQLQREYEGLLPDDETDAEEKHTTEDDNDEQRFALEADLRDFLAHNLSVLEPQLKLYQPTKEKEGIEFQVDQGRIDILAIDANGKYVVIELKLSRGREKALGQLLYYMGWVDAHLGNGPCRGVIVADDISNALTTAVKRVPGVSLFSYRVAMSVEKIA